MDCILKGCSIAATSFVKAGRKSEQHACERNLDEIDPIGIISPDGGNPQLVLSSHAELFRAIERCSYSRTDRCLDLPLAACWLSVPGESRDCDV